MKKILLQLDTDGRPSAFDAIVAYDADVDVILPSAEVTPEQVRDIVQEAFFTRGPGDLKTIAIWVGGSNVADGEKVHDAVKEAGFGPVRVSSMLDSNGCNTTAAAAVVRLVSTGDMKGAKALVIGLGAVGLRAATLLDREGAEVTAASIPADVFGDDRPYHRPRGLTVAEQLGLEPVEPADREELGRLTRESDVVLAAGPGGVVLVRHDDWAGAGRPRYLADFNAAEPLGVEGIENEDDLTERDGALLLGALGIGARKMKVHKACVRSLFDANDLVLGLDGVYEVAKEMG